MVRVLRGLGHAALDEAGGVFEAALAGALLALGAEAGPADGRLGEIGGQLDARDGDEADEARVEDLALERGCNGLEDELLQTEDATRVGHGSRGEERAG